MDTKNEDLGKQPDKVVDMVAQHHDPIKEAELLRIHSEIARNEAEKQKLLSEAKNFESRVSIKPKPDTIIKAVIGGMVAAALLAAWAITYLQPLLQKKTELSSIENRILDFKNQEQTKSIAEANKTLDSLRKNANQQLSELQTQNNNLNSQLSYSKQLIENLQGKLDQISKDYQKRSQQEEITKSDKAKYANLVEEVNLQSNILKKELAKITIAQQKTEDRSTRISDQLISYWLIENNWILTSKWQNGKTLDYTCKFTLDGKMITKYIFTSWFSQKKYQVTDSDNNWQIKDGTFSISINDNSSVYTAIISQMETPIRGTGKNKNNETCDWILTKE